MPLKLYPPTAKHPTWRVRGKYLGIGIDRSTGARKRSVAQNSSPSGQRKSNVVPMSGRKTRRSPMQP
jgi:hypothetical protein